ncbi:hypothetical protein FCIRC_7303 [Fusarium circinatum]|uniref:Uncharacterized protein n=1 Tax=Fusarium circinatum TaxID=48490 RepID=A0A8H5TUG6_FUSCI|nr:hypothetical protein FCIRC_7303 [Fusarium circinatum]
MSPTMPESESKPKFLAKYASSLNVLDILTNALYDDIFFSTPVDILSPPTTDSARLPANTLFHVLKQS